MPNSVRTSYDIADDIDLPDPSPLAVLVAWPLSGRPSRSPLRLIAAAGALTEAISHVPLLMQGLSEAPYIGVGFLLLSVAGFLLGQLLITHDSIAVWASTLLVSALALVGYTLSRTTGLPQLHDYVGQWGYPLGVVSLVGEAMMLIPSCIQLMQPHIRKRVT